MPGARVPRSVLSVSSKIKINIINWQNLWEARNLSFRIWTWWGVLCPLREALHFFVPLRGFPFLHLGEVFWKLILLLSRGSVLVQQNKKKKKKIVLFHLNFRQTFLFCLLLFFFLEPVGSTKPKFPISDIVLSSSEQNKELNLLCPAQGFPVPSFRFVNF